MNRYVCIRAKALEGLGNAVVHTLESGLILVDSEVPLDKKGLVCVNDNPWFTDENLPLVKVKKAVLEGTDGVGKTSTIEGLIKQGIVCGDREPYICQYMLFNVDMGTRCKAYEEYFRTGGNAVIFLVNNSKEELERRVYGRGRVSEFDRETYAYNLLYKETFGEMQKYQTYGKLKMVDCTGLTIEEQIEKVKQCLMLT